MQETRKPVLAVLGGTGDLGSGLAKRWAMAGYPVVIGSRAREKAEAAAAETPSGNGAPTVRGLDNVEAARAAEIVVVTVPFANQRPTLESIKPEVQGKIVVDVTVPLMPPKVGTVQMPPEGSAGLAAQQILGDGARVVSAFQNVGADHLQDAEHAVECDVLVAGDSEDDREQVIALAQAAGLRGIHAGPLANSVAAEALTSILIQINRRYKVAGAGIKITGEMKNPSGRKA